MAEPEIRYTTTADGVAIAYAVVGEGPPLLFARSLLSPGLDDEIAWSTQLWPALKGAHSVVLWDVRGRGLSGSAPEAGFDDWLADMDAVADATGADRFDLVGVSVKCHLAMAYAVREPNRVNRMALYAPSPPGFSQRRIQPEWLFALASENWHDFVDILALRLYGWGRATAAQHWADRIRAHFTSAQFLRHMDVIESIDATRDAGHIRTPTLVIDDRVATASGFTMRANEVPHQQFVRQLAAAIPGAQLAIIKPGDAPVAQLVERFLSGSREAAAPSRTDALPSPDRRASAFRTIVFTDIVGHTEMMQRLGDARGRDVLRDHERITREALKQHGGDEAKTDGDSFMAMFTSPSDAVECAIALQRAFAQHAEAGGEPIVVRMGLNIGEPIEEEGDFFGSAVILGARIKDQAEGGEILVPEAIRHMLSGKSFIFADRGEVAMKGFEDAVRLYDVRWRD
ncbi:MAG: adenylate/guanylate cyclase domain-containing protein [Chloroflexota bacterium]|nr:adenylate/guanylate cyclase domain-containing protein [Chloroflexota bacterium]